ncbi:dipeptide ABC transporter ATP-binding protein [Litorilinea aerophila]|uniref:Dipeptide ABC transporter ATP-binding protein n=1 Tax=Litorilinea aerophila TaxID=1204385 RepID=A0A540VER8_9CHLR|nr:dipeptide ABC transporter ATP-binding protein [Litorilinea aerophila]MCC9077005.1 dipeptide ABC transporter ATP-binding protein [Litorilinea aerophila]OUC09531.1 peptide ABC transporter ATP-binding protein [Litorilinea aerophila]GIV76787.1 MAG: ABC transporter ATP-binding protein [Litorilinea sp.]
MSEPQALNEKPILEVRHLKKYFPITKGFLRRVVGQVKAVDDVSFTVPEGKTVGLVGESGCGKTTASRCILRAIQPTAGEIIFHDKELGPIDVAKATKEELRHVRLNMQMIFQDPFSSLNPRMTLLEIVGEPLVVNRVARGKEVEERVAELLRRVGLRPEYMRRYPHAFSGGQRQRIGIARALALNPQLIVADEPVSALDVSIQAQTLNLLQDLQEEFHLSYIFIAHDLSVVQHLSDRVVVMYVGKLVEMADNEALFFSPKHPYTEALLASVRQPDPTLRRERIVLEGDVPDPAHPPSGCYFHPRCRYAEARCREEEPALREVEPGHWAACHFAEELELQGAL